MFQYQIKRVKENITPFIIIGFIVGFFVGKSEYLNSIDWLNAYLTYANITVNYNDSGQKIFFEHFAPNTLLFLLIALFSISAAHRIIFGALEASPKERKGIIYSLENFSSLLAIAWLGLIFGIMWPALYFEGYFSFFKFLFFAMYPILFLFEVSCCTIFLYWEGLHKIPEYIDGHRKWKVGTRLEGLVILGFAVLMFTYHQQYNSMVKDLSQWLISLL
jgi:hypothetical protein